MSQADISDFAELKKKQRNLRDGFSQELGLKVHRALSWLNRAENSEDTDAAFIFLWIAFNAAYAKEIPAQILPAKEQSEYLVFQEYFSKLVRLDTDAHIYNAIWGQFSDPIRVFMDNRYVFQPFWHHHNQLEGYENWEQKFENSKKRLHHAVSKKNTDIVLSLLFERLYVLRNQLIHGGATWNSSVNRNQLRDGQNILGFLVPVFIDLMMDNPDENWGTPYYPVVEKTSAR